jgi:hypothetical protein
MLLGTGVVHYWRYGRSDDCIDGYVGEVYTVQKHENFKEAVCPLIYPSRASLQANSFIVNLSRITLEPLQIARKPFGPSEPCSCREFCSIECYQPTDVWP